MPSSPALPPIRLMAISQSSTSPCDPDQTPPIKLPLLKVDEFLEARSLAPNTKKAYRRELVRFMDWADSPWAEVTPRQVGKYKSYLRQQNLSPASLNRALSAVMSFYDWLTRTETGFSDPTRAVDLEKLPEPMALFLSDEQVSKLFRAAQKSRDLALLAVLSHGLRASEVCGLNLKDYDGQRLRILRAKDDSTGSVPLNDEARAYVDAYLSSRIEREGLLSPDGPLFVGEGRNCEGERLGYYGLYYLIRGLGEKAEIEDLTPHRLRHYFASKLLLLGVDGIHAQTLTRHKSQSSFKRYAKGVLELAAEKAYLDASREVPSEVEANG